MTPIMKICRSQMTHHVKTAEDVGDTGDACENKINQYEDEDQQSITAKLFDNNETGGTDRAQETPESVGNVSDHHELVTVARNGETRVSRQRNIVRKQPHPLLPP